VVLRAQLFITAGVMRIPALKFLVVDGLTIPVTMLIMIEAGYIGGNSLRIIRKDMTRIEDIAILLAIVLLVLFIFVIFVKSRRDTK
jgi:membrane protein DedA with SNARE-associated domain